MPSQTQAPQAIGAQPAFAHILLPDLGGSLTHLLAGLLLGMLASRLLRRADLHWSWAAAAVALVAMLHGELGGTGLTALVAALYATLRVRRWHREDIAAGFDLADRAALQRSPASVMRAAASRVTPHLHDARACGRAGDAGAMPLGRDEQRREVRVPVAAGGAGRHTLIVGATGSGKTVTQTAMAVAAIERGMGVIAVDPKGDLGMRDLLAGAAVRVGREFIEWTPRGDSVYNPYASGGDTEIADKALAGELFTEPHYLRQAQRYLGHAVRALRMSGAEVSLRAIVEQLEPQRLELLARELDEPAAASTFAYLDSLSARQRSELGGVRDRLAVLVESDVGPWLDPRTSARRRLLLPRAVRERAIVYFRLDADIRPLLAQMIGAAIVSDVQTTLAGLDGRAIPTAVVIDEFSAVAAEQVVRLFGRARSAGFSLILATQEIADLRLPGRERLLEQVMGNLSLLVAHRQVVPASAELIAGVAGVDGAWKVSRHSDGRTIRTRTQRPVLEPTRILRLGPGWAAVLVLGGVARARITRIHRPQLPDRGNGPPADGGAREEEA